MRNEQNLLLSIDEPHSDWANVRRIISVSETFLQNETVDILFKLPSGEGLEELVIVYCVSTFLHIYFAQQFAWLKAIYIVERVEIVMKSAEIFENYFGNQICFIQWQRKQFESFYTLLINPQFLQLIKS